MYMDLLLTAVAVEGQLATAFAASERSTEIGAYLLVMNQVTLSLFESMEPPADVTDLHQAFIEWHRRGVEALTDELGGNETGATAEAFARASEEFSDALRDTAASVPGA